MWTHLTMIAPYVPCVALHVENTHVERYEQEVRSLFPDTTIVSVPPILYIQSVSRISSYNEHLYRKLVLQFGAGRMKAHRIYRLDHCCSDPEWIVKCLERRRRELHAIRIAAYPQTLQDALKRMLLDQSFTLSPTRHTQMLDAVLQVGNTNYILFGIRETPLVPLHSPISSASMEKTIPCRAYYKMQECLDFIHINSGDRVLDIGAAPVRSNVKKTIL